MNTASMNCGALPIPGKVSLRLMKSVVTTCRPFAAAALSRPPDAGLGEQCGCLRIGCLRSLLRLDGGLDLVLDLVERFRVRDLLVVHVQNHESVSRVDQVTVCRLSQARKPPYQPQAPEILRAAPNQCEPPVLPLGSSEYFFATSSNLAPAFNCFSASSAFLRACFDAFGIDFAIAPGQRSLDQNLADIHLFRHPKLVAMLVVVGLQFPAAVTWIPAWTFAESISAY